MKQPLNKLILRGDDPTGHGHYGAKRGKRKHKGLDLISKPGETVFSPISGKVTKLGYVYFSDLKYRYIQIENKEYKVWLMYAEPTVSKGDIISAGESVGYAQNIAAKHKGGMKNHLHVQVWKHGLLTDPEPILIKSNEKTCSNCTSCSCKQL